MIYDFIVIGAGIAGASAAYELSEHSKVLIIEAESQSGYHSTGRSAALFTRNYGTPLVRKINALSEPFFNAPPEYFTDNPLLSPRGALTISNPGEEAKLDATLRLSTKQNPIIEMNVQTAIAMVPFLRVDRIGRAIFEAGVTDIQVAALLQSYLKGTKNRGTNIVTNEPVIALNHMNDIWTVTTGKNTYQTKTIINAAGAWADEIGALAGAFQIGLVAKRRTAIIVDAPPDCDTDGLPCIDFVSNEAYIKPEAGKLMISPGDATPIPPQDVQPDEMDVAILADWIQHETHIPIRRISHSWAGLRSFVADENPVVGYDTVVPDFVWHAGQGGFGIMMAPALARALAAICFEHKLPADFEASGIIVTDLGISRLT
ncbi:MAG: FAD-binding oxidoreductase [Alphaproteobacteria bacterium]|nr:FAD-binding oxidoreductase [Alphaproteobacteria bacterium]